MEAKTTTPSIKDPSFSFPAYAGGFLLILLGLSSFAFLMNQGGFQQSSANKTKEAPQNTLPSEKKEKKETLEEQKPKSAFATLHYRQTLDELDPQEKYRVVGEVFGEAKSKAEFKEFLKKYIGLTNISNYLFYLRIQTAAKELGIQVSAEEAQQFATEKLPGLISNSKIQERLNKLNLSPDNFETWYRSKVFPEVLIDKLFEAPAVSDSSLRERFENNFGKSGKSYDIRQIMFVNRTQQSRFFPESQFEEERSQLEFNLKETAQKTLEELKQHPEKWDEILLKESDDPRKSRNSGRLGPMFNEEKFGSETYQAVLKLNPGDFYGPARTEEGWHLLKVLSVLNNPKVRFRGIYFKSDSRDPSVLKISEEKANQFVSQIAQILSPEEKEKFFQETLKFSGDKTTLAKEGDSGWILQVQYPQVYPKALTLALSEWAVVQDTEGYWAIQGKGTEPNLDLAHILYTMNYSAEKQRWLSKHFDEEADKKMQEILRQLQEGKAWDELFKTYSEAPALPNEEKGLYRSVRARQYGDSFIEEIAKLNVGERKILKHNYGLSYVELVEVKVAKFEEQRSVIWERAKKDPRTRQEVVKYLETNYPAERKEGGSFFLKDQPISLDRYYEFLFHQHFFDLVVEFLELEALKKLTTSNPVSDEAIQKEIDTFKTSWIQKNFEGDPQKFQEYCKKYFLQPEEFFTYQRLQVEREQLKSSLALKQQLTDEELQQIFEREYGQPQKDEQNRLRAVQYQIRQLVKYTQIPLSREILPEQFDEPTRLAFEKKKQTEAESLFQELLKSPEKFETFVRQYSEDGTTKHLGGKLPNFEFYGKEFSDILKQTAPNQTGLFHSSKGIHLYKRLLDLNQNIECKHILKKMRSNDRENIVEKQKQEIVRIKEELEKIHEQLKEQFKDHPEQIGPEWYKRFGEMAKIHSQDFASAQKEGLIQSPMSRLVKPFTEACTTANPYELVGPVETPYGLHLIMVEKIDSAGQAAHIFFKTDFVAYKESQLMGKISQIAQEKIAQALAELKAGKSFEEVSQKYSDVAGTSEESFIYNRRKYGNIYQQQVAKLKTGEISEVVTTNLGFHIIQMLKQEQFYFDEKKSELIEKLKQTPLDEVKKNQLVDRELEKSKIRGLPYTWNE